MKKSAGKQMITIAGGVLACSMQMMGCYPLAPAYFAAAFLEGVNGVWLTAAMYIGMLYFMPLTATVKYAVALVVTAGASKLVVWANEGCPAFLAAILTAITTMILSFGGGLLEWKDQPEVLAVFLEGIFVFGAVILLNRGIHFFMEWQGRGNRIEQEPVDRGKEERLSGYAESFQGLSQIFKNMSKKNLPSGRDKEQQELAVQYEAAKAENRTIYLDADDLADLADWYAVHHKYAMATEVVEYGLGIHPDNTALLVEQAYLFLDTQHKEQAKDILERIAEESSEVKVLKANLLLGEGKEEEAEAILDSIDDKDDLANIVDVSYMYIDMGFPEKALTWLTRGLEKYAEEEAYLAVTGDCYYAQGLFEKATFFFNKLIDKNPYSAPYWFGLARCYFDQQMFDKAIEACDYATVADDEFADAYLMKGHSFFQLGNEESAMENYLQAEKFHLVSHGFINTFIGLNKTSKGEWKEGYDYLEKAITAEDSHDFALPSLYANAALCLHKMGKKRKAHQYCKKAYDLAPEEIDPYLIEGRIYMEEGEYEKGVKRWAKALEYAPYADTWHEIGMCSMEIGQLSYAKLAFEHVKEMEPDFEGINERLTSLYMLLKDKENFMKYNQLCEHPFRLEELDRLQQILQEDNQEELALVMKNIFNALQ